MIIHDYECQKCGIVQEEYLESNNIPASIKCPACGGKALKIVSKANTSPVDSSWISTVRDVVDKKSDAPHCKEFLRHPTRSNMNKWMKGEKLRPLESGEQCLPPKRTEADRADTKKKMLTKFRERNAVTLTS